MAYALMTAVLVGSFALMFALVKFSDIIISRHERETAGDDSTAIAREA